MLEVTNFWQSCKRKKVHSQPEIQKDAKTLITKINKLNGIKLMSDKIVAYILPE